MKNPRLKAIGGGVGALAIGAMIFVASPTPAQAKEKVKVDEKRTSSQQTPARRTTTSSDSGSRSSSSTSGRTPVGRSGSTGSSATTTSRGSRGNASSTSSRSRRGVDRKHGVQTRPSDPRTRHQRPQVNHRDHRYQDRGHYNYRYVPYYGWVYGPQWARYPYYGSYWGGWWGSYWDWFFLTGVSTSHADRGYSRGYSSATSALDLDVSPEEAEIWVDGAYMGIADNFDGFPEYLWLPVGQHTISLYLEGYETLTRSYDLRVGGVVRINDSLDRGASIHPEDLSPPPAVRERRSEQPTPYSGAENYREDREQRNVERQADARRQRSDQEAWRERSASSAGAEEVGRLHLVLEPGDASVYLDGVFLGLARELSQLSAGLVIVPGDHVLEMVRPGFQNRTREFTIDTGESLTFEIELE